MTVSSRNGDTHPEPAELSALVDGELDSSSAEGVHAHLVACGRCRALSDELSRAGRRLDELFASDLSSDPEPPTVPPSAVARALAVYDEARTAPTRPERRVRAAVAAILIIGAGAGGGLAIADHLSGARAATAILGQRSHPSRAASAASPAGGELGTRHGASYGSARCTEREASHGALVLARSDWPCDNTPARQVVLRRGDVRSVAVARSSDGRWRATVSLLAPVRAEPGRGAVVAVVGGSVVGRVRERDGRTRLIVLGRGSQALTRLRRSL